MQSQDRAGKNLFSTLCLILVVAGALAALQFTWVLGNRPWYRLNLIIDGYNYVNGMRQLSAAGNFLQIRDIFHSPGFQIYLASLLKFTKDTPSFFRLVRLLSWVAFALTLPLVVYVGEKYFARYCGWVAGIFLAWSFPFWAYINCTQYEVLAAGLLTASVALLLILPRSGHEKKILALFSLCVTGLSFLHPRYCTVLAVGAVVVCTSGPRETRRARLAALLGPFVVIAGAWSVYQSARLSMPIFISGRWAEHLYRGNNPRATGQAFVVINGSSSEGLRYILAHPGHFFYLVFDRWLYLWGLHTDHWWVEPTLAHWLKDYFPIARVGSVAEPVFLLLAMVGAALGLRQGRTPLRFYAVIAASMIGPLIFYSSPRYLLPTYPLIFILQAHALTSLVRAAAAKLLKICHPTDLTV